MPLSLPCAIQAVDDAIKNVQQQIYRTTVDSGDLSGLGEKLSKLVTRRTLLKTYSEEMVERMSEVNADIDKRIEKLEDERSVRIASIKHEYEGKVAELPVIDGIRVGVLEPFSPPEEEDQIVDHKLSCQDDCSSGSEDQSEDPQEQKMTLASLLKSRKENSSGSDSKSERSGDSQDRDSSSDRQSAKKQNGPPQRKTPRIGRSTERPDSTRIGTKSRFKRVPGSFGVCLPGNLPTTFVGSTTQAVKKYIQKYIRDYPHNNWKNFYHAAACFILGKYSRPENAVTDNDIRRWARTLMSASLPELFDFRLSLKDVDRVIHSDDCKRFFIILDSNLRVILKNFSNSASFKPLLLIYDFDLKQFAPVPRAGDTNLVFCCQCFSYHPARPNCNPHCPICLRTCSSDGDVGCIKATLESAPVVCFKCNAFCQTIKCYENHSEICPRPRSKLHDDIVQGIVTLI